MTDKAVYLQLINNTINSYSIQCLITKGFGLVVLISLFLFSSMYRDSNAFPVIDITFAVIAIYLWHTDANYYRKKILYSRLYKKAHKQEDVSFSMDTSSFRQRRTMVTHSMVTPNVVFVSSNSYRRSHHVINTLT